MVCSRQRWRALRRFDLSARSAPLLDGLAEAFPGESEIGGIHVAVGVLKICRAVPCSSPLLLSYHRVLASWLPARVDIRLRDRHLDLCTPPAFPRVHCRCDAWAVKPRWFVGPMVRIICGARLRIGCRRRSRGLPDDWIVDALLAYGPLSPAPLIETRSGAEWRADGRVAEAHRFHHLRPESHSTSDRRSASHDLAASGFLSRSTARRLPRLVIEQCGDWRSDRPMRLRPAVATRCSP